MAYATLNLEPDLAPLLAMGPYGLMTTDGAIPALDGMTPRQALEYPAMRPELEALLDDMAWQFRRAEGSGMMDPDRIRVLLGLRVRGQRPPRT